MIVHEDLESNPTQLSVWIFVRQDLGMTKGKICSQTAHATLGLYKDLQERDPVLFTQWASLDFPQETFQAQSYQDFVDIVTFARSW